MKWTTLARRQHGLVTRRQLLALGMTPAQIGRLVFGERLERTTDRGTFRVAGAPVTPESHVWLAVLAAGAPLSFTTAAPLWGMESPKDALVHVNRIGRTRLDWPPGVRVHRVATRPRDITEIDGLPVTNKVQTALDCMAWLPFGEAARFADRATQQGWVIPLDVERRLADQPGRWGNRQLRRLLTQMSDGAAAESERRLHRMLRSAGIPDWTPNLSMILGGRRYELDVAFPDVRLAIEVDGFDYHRRDRFQRDRTKQNALTRAGWTVLRFTWSDLTERPEYVVATVRSVLADLARQAN